MLRIAHWRAARNAASSTAAEDAAATFREAPRTSRAARYRVGIRACASRRARHRSRPSRRPPRVRRRSERPSPRIPAARWQPSASACSASQRQRSPRLTIAVAVVAQQPRHERERAPRARRPRYAANRARSRDDRRTERRAARDAVGEELRERARLEHGARDDMSADRRAFLDDADREARGLRRARAGRAGTPPRDPPAPRRRSRRRTRQSRATRSENLRADAKRSRIVTSRPVTPNRSGSLRPSESPRATYSASSPRSALTCARATTSALYEWSIAKPGGVLGSRLEILRHPVERGLHVVLKDGDKMPGARWFEGATLNFTANLLQPHRIGHRDRVHERARRAQRAQPGAISRRKSQASRQACARSASAAAIASRDSSRTDPRPSSRRSRPRASAPCGRRARPTSATRRGSRSLRADRAEGSVRDGWLLLQRQEHRFAAARPRDRRAPAGAARDRRDPVSRRRTGAARRCRTGCCSPTSSARRRSSSSEAVPFAHPLYILYSSGTTGVPKCIVHGTGGTLLQHRKEHVLHTDIRPGDVVFYFTTRGWMMWNWLVSALASGATIVLYDGAPLHPDPGVLWRIAERERIKVFGTSARYLAALEKSGYEPHASTSSSARCAPCSRPARRSRLRASTSSTGASSRTCSCHRSRAARI